MLALTRAVDYMIQKDFIHQNNRALMGSASTLLAIFLVYPFTPIDIFGGHEIYPWYFVILAFAFHGVGRVIFLGFFAFFFALLFLGIVELELLKKEPLLDTVQVIIIFTSLYYLNNLSLIFLLSVDRSIFNILTTVIVLMVMQKTFPSYFNVFSDWLTFRDGAVAVDHRSGGVKGVAPEPAYMAAIIVSAYMYSWWANSYIKGKVIVLYFIGIMLTGSLSGMFMFCVIVFLSLAKSKYFSLRYGLIMVVVASIIVLVVTLFMGQAVERFLQFVSKVVEIFLAFKVEDVLLLEQQYGSTRISTLVAPYSSITLGYVFTGEYGKTYSLFGVLLSLFSPIPWIVALYYFMRRKLTLIRTGSLFLMLFYGPMMFPLLYVGLLRKMDEKLI